MNKKRYSTREEAVDDGVPAHLVACKLNLRFPHTQYVRVTEEEAERDRRCADMMRVVNASNT